MGRQKWVHSKKMPKRKPFDHSSRTMDTTIIAMMEKVWQHWIKVAQVVVAVHIKPNCSWLGSWDQQKQKQTANLGLTMTLVEMTSTTVPFPTTRQKQCREQLRDVRLWQGSELPSGGRANDDLPTTVLSDARIWHPCTFFAEEVQALGHMQWSPSQDSCFSEDNKRVVVSRV